MILHRSWQAGYYTNLGSVALNPSALPTITNPQLLKHALSAGKGLHAKKQTSRSIILRPAKMHISVTSPFCSLRPSCFILVLSLSLLGYNSKILAGSQSTFKISSFSVLLGPWVCTSDYIPGRPRGSIRPPTSSSLTWPPLFNLIPRAGLSTSQAWIPRLILFTDH